MWEKLCPPLIVVLLLPIGSPFAQEKKTSKLFKIGVVQFFPGQTFDKDQNGFEKALADAGFREKLHVLYDRQNAQGKLANVQAITQKFLVEKFDLIHSMTTPVSQEVVKLVRNTPVVFSAVTDPVGAGLVPQNSRPWEKSGTNVTGVSHRCPVDLQFEMYTRFVPKARKWGTIYNAGDQNTLIFIRDMRGAAKKLGIELIEAVISFPDETLQATQFIAGKVQALHILDDPTAVSAWDAIVKVCNEKKIPLFASDVESVPKGAIAAYGVNFFSIGYSAGKKAARILKGVEPGSIPWGRVENLFLVVSEKAAKEQGVIIPPALLKKSDKVIH